MAIITLAEPVTTVRETETYTREHVYATFVCPLCGAHNEKVHLSPDGYYMMNDGRAATDFSCACHGCGGDITFQIAGEESTMIRAEKFRGMIY